MPDISCKSEALPDFDKLVLNFIIKKFMELTPPVRWLVYQSFQTESDDQLPWCAAAVAIHYDAPEFKGEFQAFLVASGAKPDVTYNTDTDALTKRNNLVFDHFRTALRVEEYTKETAPHDYAREAVIDPIPVEIPGTSQDGESKNA